MSKKRKPRILWLGEASFLNSGYAVYGQEVITRLYQTGKYDIAELAIYGKWDDARRFEIPWKYYGNLPDTPDKEQEYFADPYNQWGQWKFEDVCLDFRPDIVWDIRDVWMTIAAERSPFRKFYHWVIMPTIDSVPQKPEWLSSFLDADAVFAYTEFGRDYLEKATNDRIKILGLPSPAADYDVFKPIKDKKGFRKSKGFMDDILIVGTVMRNQRRKLFPDLLESFRKFLDKNPDLAKKTYLYLHVSYPDNGWEIPDLIVQNGLSHRVICSYICGQCRNIFPSLFMDALQICPKCGSHKAGLPNVKIGATPDEMSQILNLFDVYVQYSICEGFGMPMVEAAACGIPFIAVDYSAMESVLKNLGGYPVNVQRFFMEPESGAYRAYPDNDHFISVLEKFLRLPEPMRMKRSREVCKASKKRYTWEETAKIWEEHFDQVKLKDHAKTWDSPPRILQPNLDCPNNLTNEQFVRWIIANTWKEPSKIDSYLAMKMTRDLNYGSKPLGVGGFFYNEDSIQFRNKYRDFTPRDAITEIMKMVDYRHHWESVRTGRKQLDTPLFIKHAKESVS
ncbi:MAG: glycosyltransferase family 4 protein [Candidatus Kariarchaeaceae archaeon]|jgi:glycosyltransferase involved in cell wall biosynthesis